MKDDTKWLKLLKSKDWKSRVLAVPPLTESRTKKYARYIAGLLKDEEAMVRCGATLALEYIRANEYTKDIAELLKDKAPAVRATAIESLGRMKAKKYAKDIKALLGDLTKCEIWNYEKQHGWLKTTVSKVAKKVLQRWGIKKD